MADAAVTSSSDADAAAQRASEQARLRKERREAKIKAGGSARLNKITGAGGRVVGDSSAAPVAAPQPATILTPPPNPFAVSVSDGAVDDPEEVDIAQHHYAPQTTVRKPAAAAHTHADSAGPSLSEAQLRQMMLGLDRPAQSSPSPSPGPGPGAPPQQQQQEEEDPLIKMMTQMMTGGGASPFAGMPTPTQQAPVQPPTRSVTVWRVLHALFAIGLGIFFALTTPFTGSKVERERAAFSASSAAGAEEEERRRKVFFWTFATAEVVLLSSRFLFDKASTRATGMVGTAMSYVPQPYRGYLEIGQRYLHIFGAVRTDLMTCIFVLGCYTWLQSGVDS